MIKTKIGWDGIMRWLDLAMKKKHNKNRKNERKRCFYCLKGLG